MIKILGKKFFSAALFSAAFLCGVGLLCATPSSAQTAADNTQMNQSDRSSAPTADQQKNDPSDLQMTRQIRKAIMHDKSLSTNGHNVKVITQQGMVTLRGPVKDEEEKQTIERKAAEVAGSADKVHSELEVMGGTSGKPSPNPENN